MSNKFEMLPLSATCLYLLRELPTGCNMNYNKDFSAVPVTPTFLLHRYTVLRQYYC